MITVAASGDSHFNQDSRWDECLRIHNWMAGDMIARAAQLFLHPGDWFEQLSKPKERNAVADLLEMLGMHIPVIGDRGNHDSPGDLHIFNHVRPKWPVVIEEGADVHIVKLPNGASVAVAAVAWPRKAHLLASLGSEVGKEQSEQVARDQLRILFLHLRDLLKQHEGPRILMMHAMVCGSTTSVGQPLVGCDLEVSLEELALVEADIVLLSHVHKPQEWTDYPMPIIYCGSPYATAYGETEVKSYVIAEFDDKRRKDGKILRDWKRVPTPRTPMILLETQYLPDSGAFYYLNDLVFDIGMVSNADVRFRYSVDSDHAAAAKSAAKRVEAQFLEAGAQVVKIEDSVNSTTRARAPEVVEAQTLPDKLEVLWHVRQIEVEPDRKVRLFGKAAQLEMEVKDAAV